MNPNPLRNAIACLAVLLLLPAAARATADVTPPVLVSVAFAPTTVAINQEIGVTVTATDDRSGVESIDCVFRSPSKSNSIPIYMDIFSNLVGGNPLNCVCSGTAPTPGPCAEAGTWTLESVSLTDQCGNYVTYASKASGSTLAFPPGTQTTLIVTNTNTQPAAPPVPVVTSFTFSPTSVNLATSGSTVDVTVTGSNIASGEFTFVGPSGDQYEYGSFSAQTQLPAGTTGTFTSTVTFKSCDLPGTWKLDYISATSPIGSSCSASGTFYTASTLPPGTSSTTISVTNPNANSTAPVLDSLALSNTTVDVTNGGYVGISGSMIATTVNISGLSYGYAVYTSPSGKTLELYLSASTSGTSGTLQGSVYAGPCTPQGVYTLQTITVLDGCGNQAKYGGSSNPAFPTAVTGTSFLVINGTLPTGSVTVNILPSLATEQFPEPNWYLDVTGSDNPQFSGSVLTGVTPGQHTVFFTDVSGYTTPAGQTVNVAANQPTYTTGIYVSTAPSDMVQVTLLPAAVTGTALWNVDYGPLQPSGATVSAYPDGTPLSDGTHVITFSGVNGYTAPAWQLVTTANDQLTTTSGTYTEVTGSGSLTVTIVPPGAVTAGVMWNVDGGASQKSGNTVSGLPATSHTVNFTGGGIAFDPPASQEVIINANQTTSTAGTATPLATGTGSLTVTISPSKVGGWYLDADSADVQKGGATLNGVSEGGHTVNFAMATGYITPAGRAVTIVPDETAVTSGTYTKAPPFVGAAQSFDGISPSGNAILMLTMADNGKFKGKIKSAAGTYSLDGTFNSTGSFTGQTGKPPIPYTLQVTGSTASTYVLTGSANGQQITAYPGVYVKGQPLTEMGKYTALLSATDLSGTSPEGSGYATVTVGKTGGGKVAGKLADGTGFTASSLLVAGTGGPELIVFDPNLYHKTGLLSGVIEFGVPATGQIKGTLLWEKPSGSGAYYSGGIDTTLDVAGNLYMAAPVPFTTGTVTFSCGPAGISVTAPFTVTGNTFMITGSNSDLIKLKIKTSTGAMSGSFEPSGATKPISFDGLLIETPGNPAAAGYFLTPAVSGTGYSGNVTLP